MRRTAILGLAALAAAFPYAIGLKNYVTAVTDTRPLGGQRHHPNSSPMTLGNIRELGVRSALGDVTCERHSRLM
jgi:hypothetical protein